MKKFIDLGDQPNGNNFPGADGLESELIFPFSMDVCTDCWEVQLEESPSMEFMFSNHPYVTGVNMPVVSHFEKMAAQAVKKLKLAPNSLVIDIGANDGSLLGKFRDLGMRTLGVDPGKPTGKLAREQGFTICETFWNEETAGAIKTLNIKPDLITATAVFYHVEDIHSFVKGLKEVMQPKTVFMTQCVYLKDVIEKLQFDHFYHEHTMIHALAPLQKLFTEHGMRMLDVEFVDIHGGSFVLYVGLEDSPHPTLPSIEKALENERACGLQNLDTYYAFTKAVEKNRSDLLDLLRGLKKDGSSVYALGAPLKGSTLLNYCDIGPDLVELATEVNRFKIGKYTPGTHIPIVFEDALEKQPDYYLVLSWNFLDFFIEKYADFLRDGGKMIVPHPEVRVIDQSALE